MNALPELVTHPELVAAIIEQFAFMKIMAEPEDKAFHELQELDLNDIFRKADSFFVDFTTFDAVIETKECNLHGEIHEFLSFWSSIVDVWAIQQNVHNRLISLDK